MPMWTTMPPLTPAVWRMALASASGDWAARAESKPEAARKTEARRREQGVMFIGTKSLQPSRPARAKMGCFDGLPGQDVMAIGKGFELKLQSEQKLRKNLTKT